MSHKNHEEGERRLPALVRAERETARAATVGFDWRRADEVLEKIDEEVGELRHALASGDRAAIEHELGDALMALVNLARFLGVSAEAALDGSTDRFLARFRYIEERLAEAGETPEGVTLERMDALWNEAKRAGVGVTPPGPGARGGTEE